MKYSLFRKKKLVFIFSILFFIVYTLYPILNTPVLAQQVSLSLSPPLVQLTVKPGKSVLIAYTLENPGDPVTLTSFVRSFEPVGQNGQIHIKDALDGPIHFNLENAHLQLDQPFFVATKQQTQLLLKIRVPDGTPEGDYYYSLLVQSAPSQGIEGSSAGLAQATIGSNILITVTENGDTTIKGSVSEFSVIPHYKLHLFGNTLSFFDSSDTIPVRLVVSNLGSNLITPQGDISVKGLGSITESSILPQNILSDSQRIMIATPSATIICKDNKDWNCKNPSTVNVSGLFLGRYSVQAEVNFGDQTPTIYGNTYFYVVPIKYIIGILLTSIIVIIIIKKVKREEG